MFMSVNIIDVNLAICITASIFCAGTGCLALAHDVRSPVYRSFALGMAALTAETILSYLAMNASMPDQAIVWSRLSLNAAALAPGSWLAFSLSYARRNFDEFSRSWKWALIAAFVVPVGLTTLGWNNLFRAYAEVSENGNWVIPLSLCGYGFYLIVLLCSVLILANLEKTLMASHGAIRWQIKLSVLGAGVLFAAAIYVCAHVLMFSALGTGVFSFNGVILIFANILFIISAIRSELRDVRIYVSRDVFRGSFAIPVIGAYLLGVGLFAKLTSYLGISRLALGGGLIIFSVLLGAALLLSGSVRYRILRFIHIHFLRPYYDYRKIWTDFTRKTSSLVDIDHVCAAIVKTVSDAFSSSVVTIWLFEESLDRPAFGASSTPVVEDAQGVEKLAVPLLGFMRDQRAPLDMENASAMPPGISTQLLKKAGIRYCVSLRAGGQFIGLLTMNERAGPPFSVEDFDLLQTFADQAAGLILNHKLFESLGQAREIEAFQALSSFFAHDLKNIASTLSLTLSNLPLHYDDPEFRTDTLKIITKSLEKIRSMCSRLSALDRKFELHVRECDFNELVRSALSNLKLGNMLVTDLGPVPGTSLDPEQIQKVLLNLVLNACESSRNGTEILVSTCREGDYLRLSVTDRGCGMSREFMSKSLFRPFKTTKKGGSGIGLYQSRMIVEAHGGRVEARSREGHGSTFSVFLPLKGQN